MDGAELELVARHDVGDGPLEHLGPDALEQLQKPGGARTCPSCSTRWSRSKDRL